MENFGKVEKSVKLALLTLPLYHITWNYGKLYEFTTIPQRLRLRLLKNI